MAQRVAGIVYLKIDGTQYSAKGKFTYSVIMTEKTAVVGQDGVHGYKEMPVAPYIKGTLTDLGTISVQQLQNITSSTLTLELANGKTIILSQAWLEGKNDVSTEEGEYEVEFRGVTAQEQVAT